MHRAMGLSGGVRSPRTPPRPRARQMIHRPIPEANHATWILGHMAYADDGFYTYRVFTVNACDQETP